MLLEPLTHWEVVELQAGIRHHDGKNQYGHKHEGMLCEAGILVGSHPALLDVNEAEVGEVERIR